MCRDGEDAPDQQAEIGNKPFLADDVFSVDDVEEIIEQLSTWGADLPTRFIRPGCIPPRGHDGPVPQTFFPFVTAWSDAVDEFQYALNDVASDAARLIELNKRHRKREQDLKTLRNATSRILDRLRQPHPDSQGTSSKYDPMLRKEISDRLGPFPENDNIFDVICEVERLDAAISELPEVDDQTRLRQDALIKMNLGAPKDKDDEGAMQYFRIKRYTKIFVDLLELEPRDHCKKTTENYNGAYPDFIRRVMRIEYDWGPSPAALSKAIQRAHVLET